VGNYHNGAGKLKQTIEFLNVLRACACLLVVYCHLIGFLAPSDWPPKWILDQIVVQPLSVMWHFGYLGVAIFFIISGFIMTHVVQREPQFEFAVKRIFRVYPPAVAAIAVAVAVAYVVDGPAAKLPARDIILEMSLFGSQFVADAPTYTLTMELMFYVAVTMMLPLLVSRPIMAIGVIIVMPVIIRAGLTPFIDLASSPKIGRILGYVCFVPIFAFGMTLYYVWMGRMGARLAGMLIAAAWAAFIYATGNSQDGRSFQLNTFYALLIFTAAMYAAPNIKVNLVINEVAAMSYSIYLLHVPVGHAVLSALQNRIGFTLALCVCLAAVGVSSWGFYNVVERPSQAAARKLVRLVESAAARLLRPN
jgi:peptidoglycan/LPS O-acetylase OafA/YrhL